MIRGILLFLYNSVKYLRNLSFERRRLRELLVRFLKDLEDVSKVKFMV